jgi:hypothetical protein
VRQQQSEFAYIFGALCAHRDMAVSLVLPYANTQTMALHLEAISLGVPPGPEKVAAALPPWSTVPLRRPNSG